MARSFLTFVSLYFFFNFNIVAQVSFVIEDEITHTWGSVDEDLEVHATIRNTSDATKRIKVRNEVITSFGSAQTFFCWLQCYAPSTNDSPDYIELAPGESTNQFRGYYRPNGNSGTGVIRYIFYNISNPLDTLHLIANFEASPASISKIGSPKINVYPNPASDLIKFSFDDLPENASIEILNLLGERIAIIDDLTSEGTTSFPIDKLASGIYFYNLNSAKNKAIKAGRFIVL
jgi:hypothetical protein